MAFKEQLTKLKENWLLIAVFVLLLLAMNLGNVVDLPSRSYGGAYSEGMAYNYDMAESKLAAAPSYYPGINDGGFAPEVEERKLTKTSSLSSQVEQGEFQAAQTQVESIVDSSNTIVLSENTNRYGPKDAQYYSASYNLKVENSKYESVINQLKTVGEVTSFNENVQDITGQYDNAELNLEVEQSRLERYQEMYVQAETVEEKITLNDRIFDQERRIKYLQESLTNLDQRVEYSTVYVTLTEKQSEYAYISLVGISELAGNFVDSFNSLLLFLFASIPWIIVLIIVWILWKYVRRNKTKRK